MAASRALARGMADLYPEKKYDQSKKFHNMLMHVHTVPFAAGGWELLSTNLFELMNKLQKAVVLFHTNKKGDGMSEQLLVYEARQLQIRQFDWMLFKQGCPDRIKTMGEKQDIKRGGPAADADSSGLQFPLHELPEHSESPSPPAFCYDICIVIMHRDDAL